MIMLSPHALALRWRWELSRCWQRLGYLELSALAVLAAWLVLEWQVLPPLRYELQHQQVMRAVTTFPLRRPAVPTVRGVEGIKTEFLAFLPTMPSRERQLQTLYDLTRPALTLGRMDFETTRLTDLPVERLTIRFSVRGQYADMRRFLQALLTELPNLALSRISLEHSDTPESPLMMSLEVRLYFRKTMMGAGP